MSLNSRFSSRAVSRVAIRKTDESANRRRIVLILAAASALALCAVGIAKAETSVTVNPDGSVTRTETTASAAQNTEYNERRVQDNVRHIQDDVYPDDYAEESTRPAVSDRTTTIFSGTYYPLPPVYYAYPQPNYHIQPPGYTYPVGPIFPRVPSPTITNGPGISSGPTYVFPGYGYYAPQPQYPYPVYTTPSYGMNGTYYSGPTGGGGTIYSSTTTQNSGSGVSFGNGGLNIQIGGGERSTQSTTTVTTY